MTSAPVPDGIFDALASGGGGARAVAHLRAAQYGKHLLLVRRVLDAAREAGHPEAAAAAAAWEALIAAQEKDAASVAATLGSPTVGVWARRTVLALTGHRPESPRVSALGAVAASAALRAGTTLRTGIPKHGPTAVLPTLGRALIGTEGAASVEVEAGRAVVTSKGRRVEVPDDPHEDGPGWHALRRLRAEHRGNVLEMLLDDQDPDRMPGAPVVRHRLAGVEVRRWRTVLQSAWEILVEHHPEVAEETPDMILTLTPIPAEGGTHTSATPRHAFGNLGASRPADPLLLALTFAHEVQHAKLTALLDLVPLVLPDDGGLYYAPWRPDPRPASGLLQGVYAHTGVVGFWRGQCRTGPAEGAARAHREFAHWRRSTLDAADILTGSGRLTEQGRAFTAATTRTLAAWQDEPVPDEAARAAEAAARSHLARWRERNGGVGSR